MKRLLSFFTLIFLSGAAHAADANHRAIFAGGCFWCMQADFASRDGVISAISGYTGGTVANPTYEQVSSGTSGHAEAIEVMYDPTKITYEKLLEIFWDNIDPTDKGGQFADRGTQYRTAIYYMNAQEKALAEASKKAIEAKLKQPIYTEITEAKTFYPAEDYHQDYYKKNPVNYNAYKFGSGRVSRLKQLWGK